MAAIANDVAFIVETVATLSQFLFYSFFWFSRNDSIGAFFGSKTKIYVVAAFQRPRFCIFIFNSKEAQNCNARAEKSDSGFGRFFSLSKNLLSAAYPIASWENDWGLR
jgi:hypothetical protein